VPAGPPSLGPLIGRRLTETAETMMLGMQARIAAGSPHRGAIDRAQPSAARAAAAAGTPPGAEGRQDAERHPAGVRRHLDAVQRVRDRPDVLLRLHPPASLRVRSAVVPRCSRSFAEQHHPYSLRIISKI